MPSPVPPSRKPAREVVRAGSLVVFFAASIAVVLLHLAGLAPQWFCLTGLPVFALLVRVAASVPVRGARLILTALLFDGAGDVVLAAPGSREAFFLTGMGLFLVGHLAYAGVFLPEAQPRKARAPVAMLIVSITVATGVALAQKLGLAAIPILVYAAALSGMAVLAALRRSDSITVLSGALLFILSDALVAVNRFMHPLPLAQLWIYSTYFGAQLLIVDGWMRDRRREVPG